MKIKQNSVIYSKKIGDEIVLLESDKEHIRQLNQTSSFLWEQLSRAKTTKQLVTALKKEFDVDQKQAEKDVLGWVESYLSQGFLQKVK